MAYQATFDDWLALLDVRSEFLEVYDGRRGIGVGLADLAAARTRWPGVDQDYVDVLDQAAAALTELRDTAAEQAAWLATLRSEVRLMNVLQEFVHVSDPPADPVDRLLAPGELARVRAVLAEIDEAVGAVENDPDRAGDLDLDAGDDEGDDDGDDG